ESVYLSRYSFQQSIKDKATLPLHFEPRLLDVHVDKEQIDQEFAALTYNLKDEDKRELSKRAAQMANFVKAPERILKIAQDVINHYSEKVEPNGFKAQIVCYDRKTCVLYKNALDNLIAQESSKIVMTVSEDEYKQFKLSKDEEEKQLDIFRDPTSNLKFLIVTNKLLAGFDAPILQTMYLDKPLKDHNLLQGICRANRPYKDKTHGLIVDYFGVFDDVAKALDFDEKSVQKVITNISQLKKNLKKAMDDCLAYFPEIDRDVINYDALLQAQECINNNEKRDAFAADYSYLSRHWEAISPDPFLNPYEHDYKWLSNIYQSVKPTNETGRLIWHTLGAKTVQLIHKNIHVDSVNDDLGTVVVNADILEEFIRNKDPKKIKKVEIEIKKRIEKHKNDPQFIVLSERLQKLKEQAEQGLINSIQFLKYLIKIAEDLLKAEKEETTKQEQKTAKAALTELFQEIKTSKTPKIVENIVNDIDELVRIVRFEGWQNTTKGQREVKQALRKTLFKYQLHNDQDLFDRAYKYIEQYY
ncbi:type I restriction endonuclease subunit R, partial [candidate division KSB1 bacterium]|nr:type I restriction endonuclease subunit R [candidate division KSB1 bacterium]